MTVTNVKAMIAKGVTVVLLAGAVALAAPAKAEAQQFAVGVQFGSPYYGNDYDARQRYEEYSRQQAWARHEAEARHEAWVREQAYDRYAYGYRDHERDRRDRDDHRDWDRDHR